MAKDTRSGRKVLDDDSNSSKKRQIGGKGTTSGSAATDTSGLRRSARETLPKKQNVSSSSSTRKSERIEKRTPATPPAKRKSERVEKKRMPSPLRRSERDKKRHLLSSSGSKKSEKGSTSSDTKSIKGKREKNGKQLTLKARDGSRNEKQDSRATHVILKEKRLDACSYRALLRPRARKVKETDLDLKRQDKLSQAESNNTGASVSKEIEGGDGCSETEGEEPREELFGRAHERDVEKLSYGLRKFADGTSRNHGGVELSHFNRKRKNRPDEALGSENGDSSSKCNDSALQSAPHEDTVNDSERVQVDCSAGEGLRTPKLIESTSEGRPLAGYVDLGMGDKVRICKRKSTTVNIDSAASLTIASKEICSSDANMVSLSPSGSKRSNFIESCVACSKRPRLDFDSPKRKLCSCKAEEVCKQTGISKSAQKDKTVFSYIQMDENHGAKYNPDLNASELLPEAQKGESEAKVSMGLTEDCDNGTQRKKSPLAIQAGDHNACVICKLGGKLLCCDGKGCKRSFHLSCLDPPLKDVPPGVWHCLWCVKKKIELGVHSVSEGVDSIWDAREVVSDHEGMEGVDSIWDAREVVSDHEGIQRLKQYLVKYRGVAHIHNHWVPETQLLLEAPMLVAKFNRKNQVKRWKLEWTVPHRLIQKRLLMSPKQHDEYHGRHGSDIPNCHYEWLVKWSGLGYEHATWELENAAFLRLPEALKLIRDYESRHDKVKGEQNPFGADKVLKEREVSFFKPSMLPVGGPPGLNNYHPNFINNLREYWHKAQNAVVIDDQERVRKVVLFILSLQSDVRRPFLIVSASSALSIWEAEFLRLAPSVNVVVYNGTRDVRKNIRTLEFYEEGGCIMFEVLLSPLDAIVEDLETLECIGWEVIVVDECQRPSFSTHFEQIKMLPTGLRLLLVSGQIKDSITDYLNMLSFLDPEGDGMSSDGLKNNSNDNIGELKERLARFVAFERKSDSSRFVEYWVPARLSNVQLEQYCATLLSNCMLLRSCSKNDSVGALRDIVISTKKCCDHPYLVNESLQSLLTKGLPVVEYLDVGIKASGKLQLLDKILTEIKNRGLRVVILFQSIGGSGRDSIGDILDDFLRQRFGKDSYERIDSGGIVASKKQAALNMFNNKESGRFVFLIENRACLPSIKLSSVDAVILFDSDWNPLNDIRALQKITIDSQYDQIKVFRLYSSCTVEEKVLILAKQGMTLDSNIPNISRSTSHMLLIWGASYLFNKLDEFHGTPGSGSNISSEHSLLNDVIQELLTQLPENSVNTDASNCSIILKVQQSGATYLNNISLLGEVEMPLRDDELPHVFWTKLLEERYPQWRYSSGPSQRIRRKVQYCNESLKKSEVESDEVIKKRKKVVNTTNDPNSLKPSEENKRKVVAGDKEGASGTPADKFLPRSKANMNDLNHVNRASSVSPVANYISEVCEAHMVESDERRKLHDAQKSLHLLLKPEISKLCQILQLPEDVKGLVGRFLEYIMNNHHVNREPVTILQAFQISLCWTAASLLKYKIDRKESLALAKQCLNFDCKEEEAEFIYSKLRMMKKMFSHHTENVKESISSEDPVTRTTDAVEIIFHIASKSTTSDQQELAGEIRESSQYHYCSDQQVRVKQEQASDFKMAQESDFSRSIRRVEKICTKRMKKVLQKQKEEVKEYIKMREKEKEKLEEEHKLESAIIRRLHTTHISVRLDKLKMLDHNFAKRMEEHNHQWEINRKNLEAMQLVARNEEKQMKACWLEEVKLGKPVESFGKLLLLDSRFRLKHMETSEQAGVHDGPKNAAPMSGPSSGKQNSGGIVPSVPGGVILAPDAVPSEAVECVVSMETLTLSMESNREKDGIDTMASEGATVIRAEQHNSAGNSNDGSMSAAPRLGLSADEQNPTVLSMPGEVPSEVPKTVPNVLLEGSDPRGMETLSLESNIQNDVMHSVASEKATVTGLKRHNRASSSIGGDSPSMELTWRGSPLAEPQINPAQGSPLSSHQVLPVGHSQPFISAGVQENNASSGDVQNSPQQVEVLSLQPINTVLCNPSNNDSMVVQPVLQKQLPVSTDPPFAEHDQPNAPVAEGIHHQLSNDGHTSVHQPQVPTQPLVEDLAELSNHSIPQPTTHLRLHPHIDSPVRRSETHVSDLRSTCIIPELNNRPLQMAPVTSHWHPDPLQFEMGRIHKEREQAIKTHEETKLRLKAECDKEIEEIRRKYNNLLQGAETELIQKRKSLETNYNKVYMSRILAEAFRSKCSEAREAGAPGLQQEAPSSFMHQLLQLSLQQPSMRPVSVADSQTIRLPTAPPMQVIHSSASFSTNLVGPHSSLISRPTVNVPVGSELRAPAPHLRPSRPALSMSAPNLLPLLHGMSSQQSSSNLPPTQNLPVHSELRAPAPHIRPSRPATSMSAPDFPPLPCGMSSLQSSSNPPPTQNLPVHSELRAPAAHHQPFRPAVSVSAPDFPPLPCGMSSSQSSSNPPATFSMRSQLTPQLPGPCSRTHQPQNTGEFPALHNSSLSALELLKDIDHRAGVNSPNFTPPMQDLCPPFDTWVPSELAVTGSVQGTIASTGAATDIVCLSDDEGSDNDK